MIVLVLPLKYVQLLSLEFTLIANKLWLCDLLELQNHNNVLYSHVIQTQVYVNTKFADGYTRYLQTVYQLLLSYFTEQDRQGKYNVI